MDFSFKLLNLLFNADTNKAKAYELKNYNTSSGDYDLASILSQEWYWIIVISIILVLVIPLGVVWFILNLPPTSRLITTIAIIIIWGIVSGYKDWLIAKRQEKER